MEPEDKNLLKLENHFYECQIHAHVSFSEMRRKGIYSADVALCIVIMQMHIVYSLYLVDTDTSINVTCCSYHLLLLEWKG